jgi:hypothetical protein
LNYFLWRYLYPEIRVASFGVSTLVKSGCFFNLFLRDYLVLMSFNIRSFFLSGYPRLMTGLQVWQVNRVDSVLLFFFIDFFFSFLSFNIVFDWELDFTIYFDLIFMRLSRSYDPKIVLNELTHIDLAYFLCHFFN